MVWRDAVSQWFQKISGMHDQGSVWGTIPSVSKRRLCRRWLLGCGCDAVGDGFRR